MVAALAPFATRSASAQDSTFKGITISGVYNPMRDKPGIAVLPVSGAFGDSIRAIIQRDLDHSDRFTVIPLDVADTAAFRAAGGAGLNYPAFARLGAVGIVQVTPVATGLHVSLHDVAVESAVRPHGPLQVDEHARPEPRVEGGAPQRLPGQLAGEALRVGLHRGQATAVHRDRSPGLEPRRHGASLDAHRHHVGLVRHLHDRAHLLDDAGEHV